MALGDFFQDSPNYINPDYVTPEQRKQQRAYAEALQKRSAEKVNRPAGAIANMIEALTGRLEMNRAGNLEQQALGNANNQQSALIAALQSPSGQTGAPLQGGGSVASIPPPPADAVAPPPITATPPMGKVNPVTAAPGSPNATVADRFAPAYDAIRTGEFDPQGLNSMPATPPVRVASLSPAGGSAPSGGAQASAPVLPTGAGPAAMPPPMQSQPIRTAQLDPRLLSGLLTNQMTPPETRAMIGQLIGQKQGEDVYGKPTQESLIGGVRPLPVAPGVTPGYRAPETVGPAGVTTTNPNPAPGYGGPSSSNEDRRARLAAEGRGYQAATNLNNAQVKTTEDIIASDAKAGYAAPEAKKALGVQKQNIERWGHLITFGPAGDAALKGKEFLVNAGLGGADLAQATAAAESINKMGTQLASSLAQTMGGGRTENEYFNLLRSVPGLTGSQQGALAMNNIMAQSEDKKQQLLAIQQQLAQQGRMADYPAARQKFFAAHPIVNPITGHDIELDFNAAQKQGSTGAPQTATNPQTGQKIKLENGKWVPMQ